MGIRYKKFSVSDILNINSTKGIHHACNVQIDAVKTKQNHPYVVRTSQNNGRRGYIVADEQTLNPGHTISFAQDTAQMFYQAEPYFTGNKVKVMSIKGRKMTENVALFLISCLRKSFSMFGWGQSYDIKILQDVELSLPVLMVTRPDWPVLETLLRSHAGGCDMSKIDTSSWKKFKVSELFTAETGNVDLQQKDVNGKGVALVSSGESNTGVIGLTDVPAKVISENTITVDMFGSVQYRDFPYKMVTHARVFALIPKESINQETGLFLATLLQKLTCGFSYNNMCSWNKIKDLEIALPSTIAEVPDWDYMESYIAKLEQERIAELEQERIAELEQYLVATGLNDYTLTNDDLKTLSSFRGNEAGDCPVASGVRKEMREFRMGTIFEKKELKWRPDRTFNKAKDTSQVPTSEFSLPLVNAKHGDNGIMFYGRPDEWDSTDMAIDIVSNGAIATGDVYPQPQNTGVLWDAYLIKLVDGKVSSEVLMYLAGVIEKSIKLLYGYDNKAVWNKVQHDMIELPIQTDVNNQPAIDPDKTYHPDGFIPDWDYMAAYIRAIEKLVIKDVVDFKDAFIANAKIAVDKKGVCGCGR